MQRFDAGRFANLVSMLGRFYEVGARTSPTLRVEEPQKSQSRQCFVDGADDCELIGFTQSRLGFLRAVRAFDREDFTHNQFAEWCIQTSHRLVDEASSRWLFVLDENGESYYREDGLLFGSDVATSFGSASFDIEEMGKCLATGRSTAAVLHAMRVFEVGLAALARHLDVDPGRANWHKAIDQIEGAISSISRETHGSDWREEQTFCSDAALQFRYLKDAWRNHAMHGRDTYDSERAQRIVDHTRDFMRQFATRLRE
jgi:hypothetical protein